MFQFTSGNPEIPEEGVNSKFLNFKGDTLLGGLKEIYT
jgi:hypothetical protein